MKIKGSLFYTGAFLSVAFMLTIWTPLRANLSQKHSCSKTWVLTFPSGQGNTLYCAQFEDGTKRCSPEATDVPKACEDLSARDSMLML